MKKESNNIIFIIRILIFVLGLFLCSNAYASVSITSFSETGSTSDTVTVTVNASAAKGEAIQQYQFRVYVHGTSTYLGNQWFTTSLTSQSYTYNKNAYPQYTDVDLYVSVYGNKGGVADSVAVRHIFTVPILIYSITPLNSGVDNRSLLFYSSDNHRWITSYHNSGIFNITNPYRVCLAEYTVATTQQCDTCNPDASNQCLDFDAAVIDVDNDKKIYYGAFDYLNNSKFFIYLSDVVQLSSFPSGVYSNSLASGYIWYTFPESYLFKYELYDNDVIFVSLPVVSSSIIFLKFGDVNGDLTYPSSESMWLNVYENSFFSMGCYGSNLSDSYDIYGITDSNLSTEVSECRDYFGSSSLGVVRLKTCNGSSCIAYCVRHFNNDPSVCYSPPSYVPVSGYENKGLGGKHKGLSRSQSGKRQGGMGGYEIQH